MKSSSDKKKLIEKIMYVYSLYKTLTYENWTCVRFENSSGVKSSEKLSHMVERLSKEKITTFAFSSEPEWFRMHGYYTEEKKEFFGSSSLKGSYSKRLYYGQNSSVKSSVKMLVDAMFELGFVHCHLCYPKVSDENIVLDFFVHKINTLKKNHQDFKLWSGDNNVVTTIDIEIDNTQKVKTIRLLSSSSTEIKVEMNSAENLEIIKQFLAHLLHSFPEKESIIYHFDS